MKRQILSTLLAAALCLTAAPAVVFAADDVGETTNAPDTSSWTVNGSTYTCNSRLSWPDYSVYPLGNISDGQIVTLSADMTVSKKGFESSGEGGNMAFFFGINDADNDGRIEENGDQYYLVQLGTPDNEAHIGIERNDGIWGNWAQQVNFSYKAGDKVTFTATYDYTNGNIMIYADGKLVVDHRPHPPERNRIRSCHPGCRRRVRECGRSRGEDPRLAQGRRQ